MTVVASRRRFVGNAALLVATGTVVPALLITLLTWRLFPDWWRLSAYFWYSIPANSFLWIPHEPAVVYAGTIYPPLLVALVGGISTLLAAIIDHAVFTRAFRLESIKPIAQTRIMKISVRLFNWQPWWTIWMFAFTPIPFYPIRVVAPLAKYPMMGYVSAVVLGRIPRYYLLALSGVWAKQLTQSFLPW